MEGFAKLAETLREEAHMHAPWYDLRAQALFESAFREDVTAIDKTWRTWSGASHHATPNSAAGSRRSRRPCSTRYSTGCSRSTCSSTCQAMQGDCRAARRDWRLRRWQPEQHFRTTAGYLACIVEDDAGGLGHVFI